MKLNIVQSESPTHIRASLFPDTELVHVPPRRVVGRWSSSSRSLVGSGTMTTELTVMKEELGGGGWRTHPCLYGCTGGRRIDLLVTGPFTGAGRRD